MEDPVSFLANPVIIDGSYRPAGPAAAFPAAAIHKKTAPADTRSDERKTPRHLHGPVPPGDGSCAAAADTPLRQRPEYAGSMHPASVHYVRFTYRHNAQSDRIER